MIASVAGNPSLAMIWLRGSTSVNSDFIRTPLSMPAPWAWMENVPLGGPSKVFPQVGGRRFGCSLVVKGGDERALLVHQIDERAMIDRVAAALKRCLLEIDTVAPGHVFNRRKITCQPTQVRIEARQIFFEPVWRVALRIHGDE